MAGPTKEDLSDQLNVMTRLAAQVERMAAAADKVEQSYTSQAAALQKLSNAMGQVNTTGAVQNVDAVSKSLKTMQDRLKDAGKASENSFQKLGKKAEEAGKQFKDKFPKSVAIATGALTGFYQGVRNIIALAKGVTGFFTSFVSGIFDLTASIIAIPFKIFEGLVDMAARNASGMNELAQAIENLRKEFGFLYGPTNKVIIGMTTSLQGFSDTGLSAWRVFGNMAQRLEAFQKLASEMGATFVTLKAEFEKAGGALLGYQKGLGLSEEHMKAVAQLSISMGDKLGDTLKETTKYSLELAKAFGLDAKVLSREMVKAMQDVKHFAGATTKEIGEAATYARKLGLELDKITGTLDAFETFDTAAENVAKLSQSFGVTVDAFQLMEAQDPATQIDMLRKSFAQAGVDASQFNRQQLKLLTSTTGLDEATARQAFSLKNQGVSLDQVKKKGSDAEKKTLTQAQAMGKLADAIERMVQQGGGLKGGFWDTFIDGVGRGIMSTKEFWGLMRNIQVALRQVQMIGVQLGRALVKIVPGIHEIGEGLNKFFEPKHFANLFKGISKTVEAFVQGGSVDKAMQGLQDSFMQFLDAEGPGAQQIMNGFKKFMKFLSNAAAEGMRWLSEKIKEGLEYVTDLVSGRKSLDLSGAAQAGKGGLGFLGELLTPLIAALKDGWKKVKPALFSLLSELAKQAWNWVKDHKGTFIEIGLAMVGYLFAKTLVGAAVGLLSKVVVDAATGMLASAASGILRKVGADTLALMFENAGASSNVTSAITKSLQTAFGGSGGAGAKIGEKIGTSAAESMASKSGGIASSLASKLGASGIGSVLGAAVGVAAVAYLAVEGKKAIDEAYASHQSIDKNLQNASIKGVNAFSRNLSVEERQKQIEQLKASIAEGQAKIADRGILDKGFSKTASFITQTKDTNEAALDNATDTLKKLQDIQDAAVKRSGANIQDLQKKAATAIEAAKTPAINNDTLDDVKDRVEAFETLNKKLKNLTTFNAKALQQNIEKLADTLRGDEKGHGGITGALQAVSEMVKQANDLDKALADDTFNKIDIKARLERVAKAVGLGGKAQYTVNPNKQVQIVVNLEVSMDVDKVEKVMIMRKQSIIRDRLNYATGDTAGKPGNPPIPDAFQTQLPLLTGGTE